MNANRGGPATDPFADAAGAYVLGALPPGERAAFERHLDGGCAACGAAVAELAGLPGLLALVPAEEAAGGDGAADEAGGVPDTVLPALLGRVRARRRRTRAVLAAAAAGLAAAASAVAVLAGGGPRDAPEARPQAAAATLAPVGAADGRPAPVVATARLTAADWGTRITLRCHERGYGGAPPAETEYVLVVADRAGREQRLASWRAHAGKDAVVEAGTSLPRQRIGTVGVRTASGRPVLRLELP